MTSEAYEALSQTAARRIEQEWTCNDSEREILRLLLRWSYSIGKAWACVPCLNDLVAITGFHKSSISRALRSLIRKRYVMQARYGEQMLYGICTGTRGVGVAAAPERDAVRAAALARMDALNKAMVGGQADADGQMRMPGMFDAEDVAVPAAAFEAMMESVESGVRSPELGVGHGVPGEANGTKGRDGTCDSGGEFVPRGTEFLVRPGVLGEELRAKGEELERDPDRMDAGEFARHLERLARAAPVVDDLAGRVASRDEAALGDGFKAEARGLKGEARFAFQRVFEECRSAGKVEAAAFLKYAGAWRTRCRTWPHLVLEACGEHKARRQREGAANQPGAFIYRSLQDLLGESMPMEV